MATFPKTTAGVAFFLVYINSNFSKRCSARRLLFERAQVLEPLLEIGKIQGKKEVTVIWTRQLCSVCKICRVKIKLCHLSLFFFLVRNTTFYGGRVRKIYFCLWYQQSYVFFFTLVKTAFLPSLFLFEIIVTLSFQINIFTSSRCGLNEWKLMEFYAHWNKSYLIL